MPTTADDGAYGSVFMDAAAFAFLDATGATTNMVCRYGWSRRGKHQIDAAPFGMALDHLHRLRALDRDIAPLVLRGGYVG